MEDYYTNPNDLESARYSDQAPQQIAQQMPAQMVQRPAANQAAAQNANQAMNHKMALAAAQQYKYNQDQFNIDFKDVLKRIVKYLIEGLAVAFVAYYFIGRNRLNVRDIVVLGITAAFVFAILDTFSPTIALGARFGAGFGIGQGLFGVGPLSGALAAPVIV